LKQPAKQGFFSKIKDLLCCKKKQKVENDWVNKKVEDLNSDKDIVWDADSEEQG
jgi:hypothetical protein